MYRKFYGLAEKPFEINPDPKFLYLSENHREALAHLIYAVREKKGFTVITGEVGTGKTTLINSLLSRLDGRTRTAFLFNPKLEATDFFHSICEDLGLKVRKTTKGQYLSHLHNFLLACYAGNENVLLIIDEAQTLSPELLEEVRLLTNLETPKSKLLQVILMGQPELNETLNRPEFRPLKQRAVLRYNLQVLSKGETGEYIRKRLRIAGAVNPYMIAADAIREIYKYSGGIPRLVNIICDHALLAGYTNGQRIIGRPIIREVVKKLESRSPRKKKLPGFFLVIVSIGLFWGALFFGLFDEVFPKTAFDIRKWTRTLMDIPMELWNK